jgi:hypothetical protein
MVAQTHLSVTLYIDCLSCLAYSRLGVYIVMIASWSSSSVYSWMGRFSALVQLFLKRLEQLLFYCISLFYFVDIFCFIFTPSNLMFGQFFFPPRCLLFGLFLVWQRLLSLLSILNTTHSKVHIIYSLGLMTWRLAQSGSREEWKGKGRRGYETHNWRYSESMINTSPKYGCC